MNIRAYVVSIEFSYEGETVIGTFGSLDYAKSRAIAHGRGDTQHVRLYDGSVCELHVQRGTKYRRVPGETPGLFSSVEDGWTDWSTERA